MENDLSRSAILSDSEKPFETGFHDDEGSEIGSQKGIPTQEDRVNVGRKAMMKSLILKNLTTSRASKNVLLPDVMGSSYHGRNGHHDGLKALSSFDQQQRFSGREVFRRIGTSDGTSTVLQRDPLDKGRMTPPMLVTDSATNQSRVDSRRSLGSVSSIADRPPYCICPSSAPRSARSCRSFQSVESFERGDARESFEIVKRGRRIVNRAGERGTTNSSVAGRGDTDTKCTDSLTNKTLTSSTDVSSNAHAVLRSNTIDSSFQMSVLDSRTFGDGHCSDSDVPSVGDRVLDDPQLNVDLEGVISSDCDPFYVGDDERDDDDILLYSKGERKRLGSGRNIVGKRNSFDDRNRNSLLKPVKNQVQGYPTDTTMPNTTNDTLQQLVTQDRNRFMLPHRNFAEAGSACINASQSPSIRPPDSPSPNRSQMSGRARLLRANTIQSLMKTRSYGSQHEKEVPNEDKGLDKEEFTKETFVETEAKEKSEREFEMQPKESVANAVGLPLADASSREGTPSGSTRKANSKETISCISGISTNVMKKKSPIASENYPSVSSSEETTFVHGRSRTKEKEETSPENKQEQDEN